MAYHGGGQMQGQGPTTGWCDYCGQKPKFPPYNYCGKGCGAKARAAGNAPSHGPPMCKQCGQRPVYGNHEFCGRRCAGTWQSKQGQINTSSRNGPPQHMQQSWNTMPPAYMQNMQNPYNIPIQPPQHPNQGVVRGFSQNQQPYQPQPIQQHLGPPNMQHFPGQTSPMMVSPPMTPLSSGTGDPPSPGEFDPMYPPSPGFYSPSSPAGPGIQDPNAINPAHGPSRTMNMAMHPTGGGTQPNYEDDSDLYADADDDGGATPLYGLNPNQLQGEGQNTGGPPTGTSGGHGNGSIDPNQLSSKRPTSTASGSSATCRLNGCDKPVFTDPTTGHRSEYCSQKHREEAVTSGQVNPCIMCLKMPKSQTDHFCSKACRDKALSPES